MVDSNKKLFWKKILTRGFSFLYMNYAIHCFRTMEKLVGTTINYNLFHGQKNLVTIYRIEENVEASYNKIEKIAATNPQQILSNMDKFEKLISQNYEIIEEIKNADDKEKIKELLIKLDETFYNTLCYYIFFVYLGYAADHPNIAKFLEKHQERFDKIRTYTIDTDVDSKLPELFSLYNERLKEIVPYMTREELMSFINKGKEIDFNIINKRKKEYLIIMKDGEVIEYDDEKISPILRDELSHITIDKNAKEIKGTVAYMGEVHGKVKVAYSLKDFEKVKEGDILVTPMTKPNMVPFLSRVKGIITNDGGALCHASIISREMNIPCIVGTIYATDILEDGDEVILDANNGIVKKIN